VPLAGVVVTECIQLSAYNSPAASSPKPCTGLVKPGRRTVSSTVGIFGNVTEGFSDGYQETFGDIPAWHELEAPAQHSKSCRNDL
jgi:hypothetical protein